MTSDDSRPWFVVLPDCEAARKAAAVFEGAATATFSHASGRPWLISGWPAGDVTEARTDHHRVVLIGRSSVTSADLARLLRQVRDLDDAERMMAGISGCFHYILSVAGRVRIRGSAAAVRRVFSATVAAVTVGSDRADVLARATAAALDERAVAMRLLAPHLAYPFGERSLWRGVQHVPADHCLILEPDGRGRQRRWWRPPQPTLPLAEGAPLVRGALTAAVRTCVTASGTVTADLSGGMDSTSLCFLAAEGPTRLVTVLRQPVDPGNDDALWAERARAELPGARHLMVAGDDMPDWYTGATHPAPTGEEPYKDIRSRAYRSALAGRAAALGSRIHLTGMGGDELFGTSPLYLHDLVRTRPLRALRRLSAHRSKARWPLGAALRAMARRGTFDDWVATAADGLTAPVLGISLDWMPRLRLPDWATPQARHLARTVLQEAARTHWEPLAASRAQHQATQYVRTAGMGVRQADQLMRAKGVSSAAPFLDDQVVEAALSVRPEDRISPYRYKPLLAEAMRTRIPQVLLTRSTKGDFSADLLAALERRRPELLEATHDLALERHGLVDGRALRAELLAPHPRGLKLTFLESTLACESWLRALPDAGHAVRAPATARERKRAS